MHLDWDNPQVAMQRWGHHISRQHTSGNGETALPRPFADWVTVCRAVSVFTKTLILFFFLLNFDASCCSKQLQLQFEVSTDLFLMGSPCILFFEITASKTPKSPSCPPQVGEPSSESRSVAKQLSAVYSWIMGFLWILVMRCVAASPFSVSPILLPASSGQMEHTRRRSVPHANGPQSLNGLCKWTKNAEARALWVVIRDRLPRLVPS